MDSPWKRWDCIMTKSTLSKYCYICLHHVTKQKWPYLQSFKPFLPIFRSCLQFSRCSVFGEQEKLVFHWINQTAAFVGWFKLLLQNWKISQQLKFTPPSMNLWNNVPCSSSSLLWLNLHNSFNFHGCIQWQGICPNGTSSMVPNRFIEYLHDNIRTSIHDKMLVFEVRVRIHYSKYLFQ